MSNINLRDDDGSRHEIAARIMQRNGLGSIAGAIDYALAFVDAAQRVEIPKMAMGECDVPMLREYITYGYDHYVRFAALQELERRYKIEASK